MLNPNNIKGKTFDTEKNGYSKEDVHVLSKIHSFKFP